MPAILSRTAPKGRAPFLLVLTGMALMMASSSLPSPFYPVIQNTLSLSSLAMSVVFAIYPIALLITLLSAGSASDHVGRRPILSLGFVLLALASIWFEEAGSIAGLLLARAVQGAACALLLSTLSATATELEPEDMPGMAALCNAVVPLTGMGAGALLAGFAMEGLTQPKADVFYALAALSLVMAVAVWALPETSPRHEGLLQALKPRVGLPAEVRGTFWRALPALAAGWATGGLYLSLGALIVSQLFGLHNVIMEGFVITMLAGMGALTSAVARRFPARSVLLYGTAALSVGTIVTLIAVHMVSLPLYLVALLVAGTGFGACFYGFLHSILPLAPAHGRGELFAAIFTASYLAFGVPVVIAGLLVPVFGLLNTVTGYGCIIAAAAIIAGLMRRFGPQG